MNMNNQYDFSDIAPFDNSEFMAKMASLVVEPGFEHAVRYVMPDADYPEFAEMLKRIPDRETFQHDVMLPFLNLLIAKTTSGVSLGGIENVSVDGRYTYMSNHRDIVLDAALLNYCLFNHGFHTSEVAIGNNLLIYDWIADLVKINKSFIVKRDQTGKKALEAAHQLSAYIHYAINEKGESVWIAQREGRAKDSNDMTQASLIKMMALEGGGNMIDNLLSVNITPVAISYEYDPNDYLKAREFLMRKRDPEFKKSQRDDLFSMETGILQYKGHIHFEIGKCINDQLQAIDPALDRETKLALACAAIDKSIHTSYRLYPINYVAYDRLNGTTRFADKYTQEEAVAIDKYLQGQLAKVEEKDITTEDYEYMLHMMYMMYSNPLHNKLVDTGDEA